MFLGALRDDTKNGCGQARNFLNNNTQHDTCTWYSSPIFRVLTKTGVDSGKGTRSTADKARGSGYLQVIVGGLSLTSDEKTTSHGSGWCKSRSPEK